MNAALRQFGNLFKLRIGVVISLTALGGVAMAPGPIPEVWRIAVLALAVLGASAAAGAFNQYAERDLDARMARTQGRPFVTGILIHGHRWLWIIAGMLAVSVVAAATALNFWVALHVFLGAFFYGVVYTLWLKRRTSWNIVIGGLAGSFAVLAGAAAVDPALSMQPVLLALVLFLWTPSHFWSLAIAYRDDYAAAGVPMLPVELGNARAARVVLGNTVALVAVSLLPLLFGAGWLYGLGATVGGGYFLAKVGRLVRQPSRANAMASFFASMTQLGLLLIAAMVERALAL